MNTLPDWLKYLTAFAAPALSVLIASCGAAGGVLTVQGILMATLAGVGGLAGLGTNTQVKDALERKAAKRALGKSK